MKDKCNAYNSNGDLMTLTFEQCDYYLQAVGRVHRTSISSNSSSKPVTTLETKPVAEILAENPDSHKQTPEQPEQQPSN